MNPMNPNMNQNMNSNMNPNMNPNLNTNLHMNPIMLQQNPKKRKDMGPSIEEPPMKKKKQGRRKIKIEFIEDKSRRQITFSKRKAGIMKKAYELTTLTGTQALLLIASETGHVYTFATPRLQPFVTHQEGKALIQRCLNSPEPQVPMEEPFSNPTSQVREEPSTPTSMGNAPPVAHVESSLVLMAGKQIPVTQSFNAGNLKDLSNLATKYAQQLQNSVVCLAGGLPSNNSFEMFRSAQERIVAEIVVGLKVAEVDYTSATQPSFSIDKLRSFLSSGEQILPDELWQEISAKPYVDIPTPEKGLKGSNSGDYYSRVNLSQVPTAIYVVSTYPNAYVNIVYGVRKQGAGGKGSQVVGISCHGPSSHVCRLDVDEQSHQQRSQTTEGVEGTAYYHLLPELFK